MTPLGQFIQAELDRRDMSAEELAARAGLGTSHVYQIMRGEKEPRQSTLAKIARGFSMAPDELLRAIEPPAAEEDPIEQAIRQRAAQMREAVEGIPRRFWPTIIDATFKQAIDGARVMAALVSEADPPTPVTPHPRATITQPRAAGNRGKNASSDSLPDCPHERINATYDLSLVSFAAA